MKATYIVCVMHLPRWIERNWQAMKHKRVIWRTIGQSIVNVERQLAPYRTQGMQIVRYSPMEKNIPGYIGGDALIRFYVDDEVYKGWEGKERRIITFAQAMRARGAACNFSFYNNVTCPFPRTLYGPGNEDASEEMQRITKAEWASFQVGGKLSHKEQLEALKKYRAYFYTGTHPASYTVNFMEALSTGIPIVAIGPQNGNASYFLNHNLYEIPNIIQNYYNGFFSDNINELRSFLTVLLDNHELAKIIGANGRETAVKLFGKQIIKEQWKKFLGL